MEIYKRHVGVASSEPPGVGAERRNGGRRSVEQLFQENLLTGGTV